MITIVNMMPNHQLPHLGVLCLCLIRSMMSVASAPESCRRRHRRRRSSGVRPPKELAEHFRYTDVVDGDSTEGLLHYVPYTSVRCDFAGLDQMQHVRRRSRSRSGRTLCRDDGDNNAHWMEWSETARDDEAPPPYVEPLSRYMYERRSVNLDRLASHQRQRLAIPSSDNVHKPMAVHVTEIHMAPIVKIKALYDTSTPPASSSPAHNTDVNGQRNEMMPQHTGGSQHSSGPQQSGGPEMQRSFNADISDIRDERRGEPIEPDGNTSTRMTNVPQSPVELTQLPRNSFSTSALRTDRDENTRPTNINTAHHDIPRLRGRTQRPMTDLYQRSNDVWYESRQRSNNSEFQRGEERNFVRYVPPVYGHAVQLRSGQRATQFTPHRYDLRSGSGQTVDL